MLKKLLVVTLACIMVLSSMTVVSFADTNTEPQVIKEWVEDFDGYTSNQLASNDPNTLYRNFDACAFHKVADRSRHYEFSNGWYMREPAGTGSSFIGDYEFKNGYAGKAKDDKHFHLTKGHGENHNLKNIFDNVPVDFSGNAKALEFSFDWFDDGSADGEGKRCAAPAYVTADVELTDGTTTVEKTLNFGTFLGYRFTSSLGTKITAFPEMWNAFTMYISEDTAKIKITGISSNVITMNISDYDVANSKWVAGTNSQYKISKVKNVQYQIIRNSGNYSPYSSFGIDNLRVATLTAMPDSIVSRVLPFYVNFKGINYAPSYVEASNLYFMNANQSGVSNGIVNYQLSETSIDSTTGRINVEILSSVTNAKKTTSSSSATTFEDGYLKVSNPVSDKISGTPLMFLRVNGSDDAMPKLNDKVQYSYDFKYSGNEFSNSANRLFSVESMMVTGAGRVIGVSGNGVVFDPSNPDVSLAKLKANTWYSFDTIYELTSSGTIVSVYLDGQHILTKNLTEKYKEPTSLKYTLRNVYVCEPNTDGTAYLENSVCLDNLCYQVFEGGANAFNFDKSASAATNKAIANADVDFVNNTIFPVAADFTVADFYNLNLTNAVITDENGAELTVASDGDKVLAGNKIKFSGDYGKDVYYAVSSAGGDENLTKTSFVTLRENLGNTFAASANAGKLLTAKAVKDGADLEVYVAEYKDGELVGLKVGEGVANYTPKAQGNKIKVLIWNDGELVPTFTGAAYELNVQ